MPNYENRYYTILFGVKSVNPRYVTIFCGAVHANSLSCFIISIYFFCGYFSAFPSAFGTSRRLHCTVRVNTVRGTENEEKNELRHDEIAKTRIKSLLGDKV